MKKASVVISACILFAVLCVSCALAPESKIVGTWSRETTSGSITRVVTYQFDSEGTFRYTMTENGTVRARQVGKYDVQGDRVYMSAEISEYQSKYTEFK